MLGFEKWWKDGAGESTNIFRELYVTVESLKIVDLERRQGTRLPS